MSERSAILRFDVSPSVGMGHFKRALVLSESLERSMFAVPKEARPILLQAGLPDDIIIDVSDGTKWLDAAPEFNVVILDILRDGNRVSAEAEILELTTTGRKIVVIDSMPPDHFDPNPANTDFAPDVVITPYLMADHYRTRPFAKKWFHGSNFAVLDQTYSSTLEKGADFPKSPRILLSCGGSDPTSLTLRSLYALAEFKGVVDIVVGPLFDETLVRKLNDFCAIREDRVLHLRPKGLAPLIGSCNLVVGRPGLIRYEASALSRNAVFLSETESYLDYYQGFSEAGLAEVFFAHKPGQTEAFSNRLAAIAELASTDPIFRANPNGRVHVSVTGAKRVLDAVFG